MKSERQASRIFHDSPSESIIRNGSKYIKQNQHQGRNSES